MKQHFPQHLTCDEKIVFVCEFARIINNCEYAANRLKADGTSAQTAGSVAADTGDNSNTAVWIILAVAAAAAVLTGVVGVRRRKN